jgi:hypothetical protein
MPPHDQEHKRNVKYYPKTRFQYDAENNRYICPQGHPLPFKHPALSAQIYLYRAKKRTCDTCPVQEKCRSGKYGRSISRSFFEPYVERVEGYQQSWYYKKAMRKRQVWVEPLFGEAKQWHQMRRFLLRRVEKVNIEGLIKAAGQNIKRLLNAERWSKKLDPAGAMALQRSSFSLDFIVAFAVSVGLAQKRLFQQADGFSLPARRR